MDTQEVRTGEEVDRGAVENYIRETFKDFPGPPLQIRQFGAGHSNLTYELSSGSWEAVLRRPPKGPLPPKAHDMEREYNVLKAIHPFFPLAPEPLAFEEGKVLDKPFFLMERKYGIVYDTQWPENITPSVELAQDISREMVDRLVELHSIDYKETDFKHIARPEGFMKRQVEGWIKRFDKAHTSDVEEGVELKEWLLDNIPEDGESTIIHYDYKLNNAIFSKEDPSQMIGLFDWEMTTVGDPLADVGAAMSYWMEAGDPKELKEGLGQPPLTTEKGFYTREEFMERYAEKSGRDLKDMNFYLAFAYFKLAGIVQQIYYRYKQGQTDDPRFQHMNHFVNKLVSQAARQAGINERLY
ncbi:phosphotransferase family protein [Salimicrobium flavidum]|uniref:Predicted kinase, aminoglycoside phosphotransferase (APT) family n=1 Tax=Salimicrobium flavidum TaxID=570947 RepID=A0A1N7JI47_9BACI|nr:phosphotransferase family protein [Salimicrobium flavidum]SIS48999.1 Predicted kinase, aminoglycoside phosphotransferase (APT) family [Salimicrobium flavidum]